MDHWTLALIIVTGLFFAILLWLMLRGFGILKIRWMNKKQIIRLKGHYQLSKDPTKKKALFISLQHIETLQSRWFLKEEDLHIGSNTRSLVEDIAKNFYPKSKEPLNEARIGQSLQVFLEIQLNIQSLINIQGIQSLTQFRVRHLQALVKALQKKKQWEESPFGQAVSKYKVIYILKWVYKLVRCLDLVFWLLTMFKHAIDIFIFKTLLLRWYLMVGEWARQVYGELQEEPELPKDDVLEELDDLPSVNQEVDTNFPEGLRQLISPSRKKILFSPRPMPWEEIRQLYMQLVEDIAQYYYPESEKALQEARVYDLILAIARFAEQVVTLKNKPVIHKILDLRFSHILRVKESADKILNNEAMELIKKYRLGQAAKYSALIYKAFKKGHPGILFRDFAFNFVREALKRWIYVYLHEKISLEAHKVYQVNHGEKSNQ